MRKTLLLSLGFGALISAGWLRLEEPRQGGVEALGLVALAIVPALLPVRDIVRIAALALASVAAAALAFDVSPLRAWPPDDGPGFWAPLAGSVRDGVLAFYDVQTPFDPSQHPDMHGLVLLAVFAFTAGLAQAIRTRRALLATAVLAAATAWPATLLPGAGGLLRGAVVLAGALVLLTALRERPVGRSAAALAAGAVVVLGSLLVATSPAVAQDAFLGWRSWDPYTKPDNPVRVDFAWDADYSGVRFPKKSTRVFTVESPFVSTYWRATTLDVFEADRWIESLSSQAAPLFPSMRVEFLEGPLVAPAARRRRAWLRQDFEIDALRDAHLPAGSVPVAYEPDDSFTGGFYAGGIALASESLRRGQRYTVWSYVGRPRPRELARLGSAYPAELTQSRFLALPDFLYSPPFGTPNREALVDGLLTQTSGAYRPLYQQTRRVVGRPRTPYAAVVAIESWLREGGGFEYEEQPPPAPRFVPPLVDFVTRTKRGYCQHYAGAMALMLRYLGIPARVAVGFTSGRYDRDQGQWEVTDRNAHAWVEVWFPHHGWLAFDPTPSRGTLSAPYTNASPLFDLDEALAALAGSASSVLGSLRARERQGEQGELPGGLDGVSGTESANRGDDGRGLSPFGLAMLVLAAVVFLFALSKVARRRLRYLRGGPRRIARACRLELVEFMLDQRLGIDGSATLPEVAARLRARFGVDGTRFVDAANEARFGRLEAGDAAATRAQLELSALLRAVRERLSTLDRTRGAFSLRSYGIGG